jgi:hypothetical protein
MTADAVNHPAHYKSQGMEVIDVIESFGLGESFHLGNVVKYVLRAGRKDDVLQDLRKARWYLDRKIAGLSAAGGGYGTDDLAHYSLVYLATPYSKYPQGRQLAFRHAAALAARLIEQGVKVYSPIAHTHPLTEYSGLDPLDHTIWLPFDEAMMEAADALCVAHMEGWAESFGVQHEIKIFSDAHKPIFDLDPESMQLTKRTTP